MVFLQIAWSNLLRNRRRTIVTLCAMFIGIAVMVFTNGFNAGMAQQWGNSLINEQDSHLQIHHKDFYTYGISDRQLVLMNDPAALIAELRQNPHVVAVMPRISLVGLMGTEEQSTAFYGAMSDLATLNAVLPDHANQVVKGQALSADDPNGVLVGQALAQRLGLGIGDDIVLLSTTIYGDQSSALVHIRGLVQLKNDLDAENTLLVGGLSDEIRTDLLDITAEATELLVRLDDTKNTRDVTAWINQRFAARGAPWLAKPWYDEERFRFLTGIFGGIGIVVTIILSLIVSFIISNTLLMAIFERIREVGSMRALGMENGQVYRLLYLEYLLLAGLGGLIGLAAGCVLIFIAQRTGVSISDGIFTGVRPVLAWSNLVMSFCVPLGVAAAVALFPIRSSCRMSVVESLNYN